MKKIDELRMLANKDSIAEYQTTAVEDSVLNTLLDCVEILEDLVIGIDYWNESVQNIIGRQPETGITSLDRAKAALAKLYGVTYNELDDKTKQEISEGWRA